MANYLISKMAYLSTSKKLDAPFMRIHFASHSANKVARKLGKSTSINTINGS